MVAIVETENFKTNVNTDVNAQTWLEVNPINGLTWYTKGAMRYKQQHEKIWGAMAIIITMASRMER